MAATSGDDIGDARESMRNPPVLQHDPLIMNGNRLDSRDLFAAEREIIIAHGEDTYRLRLTSQNKLILTK